MCKPTAELTTFVGTVTPYLSAQTTGSSSTGKLIRVQNSLPEITMSFDQSTTPVGEDQSTSQGSDAKEPSSTSAALIAVSGKPLTLQKPDSREHDLSLSPSPVSQGNTFLSLLIKIAAFLLLVEIRSSLKMLKPYQRLLRQQQHFFLPLNHGLIFPK